jgi:hypothetical protein
MKPPAHRFQKLPLALNLSLLFQRSVILNEEE